MILEERQWVAEKMLLIEPSDILIAAGGPTMVKYKDEWRQADFDTSEFWTGPLLFALCRIAREHGWRVTITDVSDIPEYEGAFELALEKPNEYGETTLWTTHNDSLNLAVIAAAKRILEG